MIFAGVRLPDEIRIALEQGQLAVFAGAGVSVPPPSDLPMFNGLAERICGHPVQVGKEDRALGKLAKDGTNVHLAAARILYHPGTRHTKLHEDILQIFGSAAKVRVVTTNFDDHFGEAWIKVFGRKAFVQYIAPALPLGDDFAGLVHLHGSARVNPNAMVLTDKNFGAAYITRGWARDFLVALFSRYTVLFVGYSHNDVTISYLARGMNQADLKRRWALVPSELTAEDRDNWAHLEVLIEQYPIDPKNTKDRHNALTQFFTEWVGHSGESILARSRRVRTIAMGLPPESEKISEYLDYCLHNENLARDFCTAIRHPAWVGWMRAHGYFKSFFVNGVSHAQPLQAFERVIGRWLCSFVRRRFPELLLELIEANHQQLSPEFGELLRHNLWVEQKKSPDPRFAIWVSILLSQGTRALSNDLWAYLLQECKIPEHMGVAIWIVELLTTPVLRLEKHFTFALPKPGDVQVRKKPNEKKVDFSVTWPEESTHWLQEAWEKIFQPNLFENGDALVALADRQLNAAHLLLRQAKRANEHYDPLSWERSSIGPHEQNDSPLHECLSLLVDIARGVLDFWLKANPERAKAQIDAWWMAKPLLLRRLAIYGIANDPHRTADEKIMWLLSHDLVFRHGMKKEVFDVMAMSYPQASAPTRRRFLRRVESGIRGSLRKRLGADTVAYETFNVLVWLHRVDPKCSMAEEALSRIKELHLEFSEREHPDFDHWTGACEVIPSSTGFDFARILAEPPGRYLDALSKAPESRAIRDRYDFLSNLGALFGQKREWGREFMEELVRRAEMDPQIWNGVFFAWRELIKTVEDWQWLLEIIETLPRHRSIFAGVANLISHGFWKKDANLGDTLIERAATLMDTAWQLCSAAEEKLDDSYRDWLTGAINHEGGWIGEFWIHYCSWAQQRAGASGRGIPEALKVKMREALHGKTRVKVFARIAMMPWIGYLFARDRDFVVTEFLPLLDWQQDSVVAQQSWSVLLNYRRGTSVSFEEALLPYYRQFATGPTERLAQLDAHAQQQLGHYLAGLALRVIGNPVESGFFREFLPRLPDNVRGALARSVGIFLKDTPSEKVTEIWAVWLREYWDLRLVGVPTALSFEETKWMIEWCLYLGTSFPEGVQRAVQMPLKKVFAYSVFKHLENHKAVDAFPREACRFLVAVLKADDVPHLNDSLSALHGKFKQTIPNTPEFREFEEQLYLRGWQKGA